VRRELAENGFCNTRVWSRGVDPNQFHPKFRSNELRKSLGVADDGVLAVYVGRLAPEKGIHVALDGMRHVLERNGSKVSFALAGHGPDEERCRATAPPGTVFMGRLTGRALSEFYASADIFVFPSITETFGNVVLEAMSSHLALVAPDWGATTELATTETALQFPAHDPLALADRVQQLVDDPALRARIADAAFAGAATRTWDAVFDGLVADYREALKA
jgi:phosphatidylinositol alpha 1,6-mannosyltransferase